MPNLPLLTDLLRTAADAARLKRMHATRYIQRRVVHALHVKQVDLTQRDLMRALEPMFKRQVKEMIGKLGAGKEAFGLEEKGDLPGHEFHGNQWTGGRGGSSGEEDTEGGTPLAVRQKIEDVSRSADEAIEHAGMTIEDRYTAIGGSRYFDVARQAPDYEENGVVYEGDRELVTLRFSGHVAPRGSGFNTNTGESHDVSDVNVLVDARTDVSALIPHVLSGLDEAFKWRAEGDGGLVHLTFDARDGKVLRRYDNGLGKVSEEELKSLRRLRIKSASSLAKHIADPKKWTKQLIDRVLPILAVRAVEAAHEQLRQLGVEFKRGRKGVKGDLPGHEFRGNQYTDGSGGREESESIYHGTREDLGEAISRDGLKVEFSANGRVYAASSAKVALMYAIEESRRVGRDTVALVEVDKAKFMTLPGAETYGGGSIHFRAKSDVPPDMIKQVSIYRLGESNAITNILNDNMPTPIAVYRKADDSSLFLAFGVSTDAGSKSFRSTKASTASEWLADQDADLLEDLPQFAPGSIPFRLATELPTPIRQRVIGNLRESFKQDYWKNISETTAGDAERILEQGLTEGWSTRQMATELRERLGGDDYARTRSYNIARTESGNALNGARKSTMDQLSEDLPKLKLRPSWLSVLGTTTRDTHAALDGVPADEDGLWDLAGYMVPWPGHVSLPPEERCGCQCSVTTDFGMGSDEAGELISDYYQRQEEMEEEAVSNLQTKENGTDEQAER